MKRVVLVGAGHAHLFVLESFAREPEAWAHTELVLVSIAPVQHYSGMLSGHLAGDYPEDALTFDLAAICRNIGARLVTGGAAELNVPQHFVRMADGSVIDFDLLSVDVGSMPADEDVPGVREHALTVKPIHRALELRRALESSGPLVIAGGGIGGVELALCLRGRTQRPVHLVSASSELPSHSEQALQRVAQRTLRAKGITWSVRERVVSVAKDHVLLSGGERLEARDVLWITGSRAPDLVKQSGAALDGKGYLRVYDTLQSTSHDYVFAAGDAAGFASGAKVPKAGVYSVRQGPVLAHNVRERAVNGPLLAFEPQRNAMALLNCGDGSAIGAWNGFAAHGKWVMRLKDRIDRKFMRRFQKLGEGAPLTRVRYAEMTPAPWG